MNKSKNRFILTNQIREIILSLQGTPLEVEERKQIVIDIAAHLMEEMKNIETNYEKKFHNFYEEITQNLNSRALVLQLLDLAFRPQSKKKIASQISHLLNQFPLPQQLPWSLKIHLVICRILAPSFPSLVATALQKKLLQQLTAVILKEKDMHTESFIKQAKQEGYKIYYAFLGEQLPDDSSAQKQMNHYVDALKNPEVEHVCLQPSGLCPILNPVAKELAIESFAEKLRYIYRAAKHFSSEQQKKKYLMLNMESYDTFTITVEAFKKVLSDPEFINFSAGIALQAYLPDSYNALKELTLWAKKRVENGGEPIKICLTKGSYLHKEQIVASKKNWKQAPFLSKSQTDAQYKKMLHFALQKEHVRSVHIGIATHNLFDISYALVLAAENEVFSYISFELLYGLAKSLKIVLKELGFSDIFLYTPINPMEDFVQTIPYIARRIEEIVGLDNFMHDVAKLKPGTIYWEEQLQLFLQSCDEIETVSETPRRDQNRIEASTIKIPFAHFENHADTDFSIENNQLWLDELIKKWKHFTPPHVPIVITGQEINDNQNGKGITPNDLNKTYYSYTLADASHIDLTFKSADEANKKWQVVPIEEKQQLLFAAAEIIKRHQSDLVGALMMDIGKPIIEADHEISRVLDILEYYRIRANKMNLLKDLDFKPKGIHLVAPCWSRPCSAAASGIAASLVCGNTVILKPPPEAVYSCYLLASLLWRAGIPKTVLQFINCTDEVADQHMISHPMLAAMVLFSRSSTAQKIHKKFPKLDLTAVTNGKNNMIITAFSDRDLAVQDLVTSAFTFSGQNYSHCSIAIVEEEVYEDFSFREKLCAAAASLTVGPSWDPSVNLSPLIECPSHQTLRAMTSLEKNEYWLLKPEPDAHYPNRWSAGIKFDVEQDNHFFNFDYPLPLLGVVKAKDIHHAIELANSTVYGLCAGLHSLDPKEKVRWLEKIEAGNCYVNRPITGAMIRREPFGGCKLSSFGTRYKTGGPNFLYNCQIATQKYLPQQKQSVNEEVNKLTPLLEILDLSAEELGIWYASIANYAYWWGRVKHERDPSKIIGQDNLFGYVPRKKIIVYIGEDCSIFDTLRICAACLTCKAQFKILWNETYDQGFDWLKLDSIIPVYKWPLEKILSEIENNDYEVLRTASLLDDQIYSCAVTGNCYLATQPVLANGRLELLHYVREVTLSYNYERYGSLGTRDNELRRTPL